jgi:hypothetical protein
MPSPNQIYWSAIYNYFASNAPAYTEYPLSSRESSIGSNSGLATASSPFSQSSITSSPQAAEPAPYPPEEREDEDEDEECPCGFDFCDGFCAGLPDGTEDLWADISNAGIVPDKLQPHDPKYEEFVSYCYFFWRREQEEQAALDAWVAFYLNAPEPQASVDSIPCENEWERRVWGVVTRVLRKRREG